MSRSSIPPKNIKLGMYGEFPKALTMLNTGTIKPEVNQYSIQKHKLNQGR